MPSPQKRSLADRLAAQIRYHRNAYYNLQPEISDEEFDALEARLRELDPDHPALAEVGASPDIDLPRFDAARGEGPLEPFPKPADTDTEALAEQLETWCAGFYDAAQNPDALRATAKQYRAAWETLLRRAPHHAVLGMVVPPEGHDWRKARHEIPMGSLNKVNAPDELHDWANRCDQLASAQSIEPISTDLAVTEKLDGLSLEILYQDGKLEAAITRGDGRVGELITPNVLRMQGVPHRISSHTRLSIRGEIVLKRSDAERAAAFKRKVDERFEEMKSLRNTAAGLARTKEPTYLHGCRYLTAFFYDLEGAEGVATERDKLALIRELGFETPRVDFGDLAAMISMFEEYQNGLRAKIDYEIDGLVVRANNLHTATLLGELNNRPRAAVAFKFPSEMRVTTLLSILWSTGDSGRITPIAQIEPVFLAGAEVRHASLHNVANMTRLGLGPGDQILVSRRNDVIPYVEKVELKLGDIAEVPSACARCGSQVATEGEYLVCTNLACPARTVGRLKTWIREIGLLDWGEKTLERFLEEGLAKEPADLYRLEARDITRLGGFGDVSAKKLLDPLFERRKVPIATFVAGLGIESVSRETAKLLVGSGYDTIEKLERATVDELSAIGGLGPIKARKIVDGLAARRDEIGRLLEVGVQPIGPEQSGPLAGLSFCFSGAHSRPRKTLEGIIEKNGGTVAAGVTKGLKYLVLADPSSSSSKAQKARKLGTEVISELDLEALIRERGGSL